jgi:hypothetical protein
MTIKIPLRLRGIDLREVEAYSRIPPELIELSWEANGGLSLAVAYSEESPTTAAQAAVGWAKRIADLMPGVTVADVHDELVSTSDIAARAGSLRRRSGCGQRGSGERRSRRSPRLARWSAAVRAARP